MPRRTDRAASPRQVRKPAAREAKTHARRLVRLHYRPSSPLARSPSPPAEDQREPTPEPRPTSPLWVVEPRPLRSLADELRDHPFDRSTVLLRHGRHVRVVESDALPPLQDSQLNQPFTPPADHGPVRVWDSFNGWIGPIGAPKVGSGARAAETRPGFWVPEYMDDDDEVERVLLPPEWSEDEGESPASLRIPPEWSEDEGESPASLRLPPPERDDSAKPPFW